VECFICQEWKKKRTVQRKGPSSKGADTAARRAKRGSTTRKAAKRTFYVGGLKLAVKAGREDCRVGRTEGPKDALRREFQECGGTFCTGSEEKLCDRGEKIGEGASERGANSEPPSDLRRTLWVSTSWL